MPRQITAAILAALLAVLLAGAPAAAQDSFSQDSFSQDSASQDQQAAQKPVVVYTAQTATTAQLPLIAAIKAGWPGNGRTVEINYWKNLDDLRALALAGKGDVWVGHVEALARAAARGAPITLVEITAWRKFFLISLPLPFKDSPEPRHPKSVAELLSHASENSLALGSSPPNSPMTELLRRLGGEGLIIDSLPPQQLILEMSSGRRSAGMLPEPMASAGSIKNPSIAVIGSLEAEYASRFGGPDWRPQAGVAVNRAFLDSDPDLVASLVSMMGPLTEGLANGSPEDAAMILPDETREAIGTEALVKSLGREIIRAVPASEIKEDVVNFLKEAAPELYKEGAKAPPESLFLPAEEKAR